MGKRPASKIHEKPRNFHTVLYGYNHVPSTDSRKIRTGTVFDFGILLGGATRWKTKNKKNTVEISPSTSGLCPNLDLRVENSVSRRTPAAAMTRGLFGFSEDGDRRFIGDKQIQQPAQQQNVTATALQKTLHAGGCRTSTFGEVGLKKLF